LQQHCEPTHDNEADARRGEHDKQGYEVYGHRVILRWGAGGCNIARYDQGIGTRGHIAVHLGTRIIKVNHAGAFWPKLLTPLVAASTETVIWLGMKL
jgi:hypothetical protein